MLHLEVSCAVRLIYTSVGAKGLNTYNKGELPKPSLSRNMIPYGDGSLLLHINMSYVSSDRIGIYFVMQSKLVLMGIINSLLSLLNKYDLGNRFPKNLKCNSKIET